MPAFQDPVFRHGFFAMETVVFPPGQVGTSHFFHCYGADFLVFMALRMKMMKTEGPSAFFAGAIPRCVQVRLLATVASEVVMASPD